MILSVLVFVWQVEEITACNLHTLFYISPSFLVYTNMFETLFAQ